MQSPEFKKECMVSSVLKARFFCYGLSLSFNTLKFQSRLNQRSIQCFRLFIKKIKLLFNKWRQLDDLFFVCTLKYPFRLHYCALKIEKLIFLCDSYFKLKYIFSSNVVGISMYNRSKNTQTITRQHWGGDHFKGPHFNYWTIGWNNFN